jgi:hypothetical protein
MTVSMPKADSATPVPPAAPAVDQDSFVINLCSSTTPMALTQPQLAELKSFKFFVSRRLEDGRERFRLHMGYFDSLLQAEDLLPMVREIYPGAWAGEAPGKRLRARAAAANPAPAATSRPPATAPAAPAAPPAPVTAARPAVPTPAAGPSADLLASMPTLSAAPAGAATRPVPTMKLELVVEPPRPAPAPAAPVPAPAPTPAPAMAAAPAPKPVPPKAARAGTPKRDASLPFDQRSNVREVLKSLDEPAHRPTAPAPQPATAALPAHPILPAGPAVRQAGVLPDSQVLRLLEEKRGDPLNTTSTPAAFSIQLQWSVQPIDLARVPPLAIFGAYTLYTVEGSREGRRWFGLRLGFFSDANSAKQVAQYVRSEFSSVAVVPVSLKERDGARGASGGGIAAPGISAPAPTGKPTERLPDRSAEFKLLDDTAERPKLTAGVAKAMATRTASAAKPKSAAGAKSATVPATGQKGAKGRGNRVNAHEKRAPKTLEETLEILGADQLQIEGSRNKLVSGGAIRHVDMKVQKNSPFSRLLDRLAERSR